MHLLKNMIYGIISVILGCVIAFGGAEVAVRMFSPQEVGPVRFVFNPDLGDIPVPYQHGVRHYPGVYTFAYTNNSLGWRGRREYRAGKQQEARVLILGDSFTYGFGVNDDQTFAARIEKNLRADHLPVEVMNAGNPGKGTDYALKSFETIGRKFHPDLTILAFFSNDFQDNERGEYYNVKQSGNLEVKPLSEKGGVIKTLLFHLPGYNWLISWSQAANLLKQAGVEWLVNRAQKANPDLTKGLVVSYQQSAGGFSSAKDIPVTQIYLKHLSTAVKEAGGALMVCYIPLDREVREFREHRTLSPDELAIQQIVQEHGGRLWSLTPLLARSGQPIEHLYYKEGHWTAAAHELAAQYLSRVIRAWLTDSRPLQQSDPLN
jgi:hypothetical protein